MALMKGEKFKDLAGGTCEGRGGSAKKAAVDGTAKQVGPTRIQ